MVESGQQKWRLELKAYEAFQQLMARADETRALFEDAGLDLPEPLARFLGSEPNGTDAGDTIRMSVSPLPHPPRPPEAESDWVWVPATDALLHTLLLAVMRGHGGPLSAKAIQERIAVHTPDVNLTSLYNAGARLENSSVISKSDDGWQLLNPSHAPVLQGEYAWGPPKAFSRQELAAHRRIVIRHLLSASADGMQVMQIVRHMQRDPSLWPPDLGAVSKDLVETDLEKLASLKRVKKVGHSRKWVAINPK
jgi:hypothetical protein